MADLMVLIRCRCSDSLMECKKQVKIIDFMSLCVNEILIRFYFQVLIIKLLNIKSL